LGSRHAGPVCLYDQFMPGRSLLHLPGYLRGSREELCPVR
jgi:hypothetical protein